MAIPHLSNSTQNLQTTVYKNLRTGILTLTEVSAEALGFAVASLAMKIIVPSFSLPLAGIAVGLLTTRLVIKVLTPYNYETLTNLTYEACQLRERYPKLQTISFVFAMSISLFSQSIALITGIGLGIYGAALLDVENYKFMQKANRKGLLEKGLH